MTVRVRFAPSPTGYLHIGGARTALYNALYAKANGGTFVIRVEDTDQERSKKEFEEALIDDLKWVGVDFDEGPGKEGEFGPYRQSERKDIYKKYTDDLLKKGIAYPCFLTSEELEVLTEKANSEKKAPHAYHGKYKDLNPAEAKKRMEAGEEHVIRFKNPQNHVSFIDLVRGEVKFQPDMVGDFVIMRSNGMPVYNFCCALDDHLMQISHVFRGEDHLTNTLRQLLIFEAIGATPPKFGHVSLLIGEDRQKLSKRHGATSVTQYRDQNYLPKALINYLCLLGWSHPDEQDIFDVDELGSIFDIKRFNKSPALYDIKKLDFFNEQHMRKLSDHDLVRYLGTGIDKNHAFHTQSEEWKVRLCRLFADKIQRPDQMNNLLPLVFSSKAAEDADYLEAMGWETTPQIKSYVVGEVEKNSDEFLSKEDLGNYMNHLKKELKIKGKPLFMGLRVVLTGSAHGPDLKELVSITPKEILLERLKK